MNAVTVLPLRVSACCRQVRCLERVRVPAGLARSSRHPKVSQRSNYAPCRFEMPEAKTQLQELREASEASEQRPPASRIGGSGYRAFGWKVFVLLSSAVPASPLLSSPLRTRFESGRLREELSLQLEALRSEQESEERPATTERIESHKADKMPVQRVSITVVNS